jgi:flagellar basal-body rod protein FlgG
MLRALSIAATGGRALLHQIDLGANNLANANTVGFKRSRAQFADLLYQKSGDVAFGTGVRLAGVSRSFEQGELRKTDRELDLALDGPGFFRVRRPGDGGIAYTRAGRLHVDREGFLATEEGCVLDPGIRVPADVSRIAVDAEGRVVGAGGGAGVILGQLRLSRFVNPSGLEPLGRTLFAAAEAAGEAIDGYAGESAGFGVVRQGHLEASNVDPIRELTDLISAHRAFEINAKVIEAADEILQAVNGLRRKVS